MLRKKKEEPKEEQHQEEFYKRNEGTNVLERVFAPNQETDIHKDKMVREWLNKDNIETKTELNQQQVYAVTTLESLAEEYKISKLKKFVFTFKKNMLSKNRGSSRELVDILKGENYGDQSSIKRLGEFLK